MKLPALFCDNMVLQRERPIPVWGWTDPGEKITVTLEGKTRSAVAGKDGRWMVRLPKMKAGGPFEMLVRGRETVTLHNVLVGEVWVCSGQSNMQMMVSGCADADKEIAAASYPAIRHFTVEMKAVVEPRPDTTGRWEICSPKTVRAFSAVAYFFGRELSRKLKVPVGLINTSWGGTYAEAWTSREALSNHPLFKELIKKYEKNLKHYDRDRAEYDAKTKEGIERLYPKDPGNSGFSKGWAAADTSPDEWKIMVMPRAWQYDGLDFSGVVWFRKTVKIPTGWAGRDLILNLAPCDKHDTTYFNNVEVGGIGTKNPNAWATPRAYRIPGRLVKHGRNVIAVRIYSYAFAGGMLGTDAQMRLYPDGAPGNRGISLAGPWRYRVEHNFGFVTPVVSLMPPGPDNPNSPYALYRGMIHPLIPYAIRGAIWYQGESNVDRAYEYRSIFPLMIRCWRKAWRQGNFPFLFVQLANYMEKKAEPGESTWAELREAQTMTLRLPATGMAVAIDIGEASDIHPKNKQDVGRRLAQSAFSSVYGLKNIRPSGPLFKSAVREGGKMRISFEFVGKGLKTKGKKLTGFAIAGADRKFVWAEAKISGSTVVIWNKEVQHPVSVRYAWADNPVCNLYNKDALPASPFRTDKWPGLTRNCVRSGK